MAFISNLSEEIQFARSNKPKLRPLFWLVDFLKLLIYVAMAGAFAIGIWWILYGSPFPDSDDNVKIKSASQSAQSDVTMQLPVVTGDIGEDANAAEEGVTTPTSQSSSTLAQLPLPASKDIIGAKEEKNQQVNQRESTSELIDGEVKVFRVKSVSLPEPLKTRDGVGSSAQVPDSQSAPLFKQTVPILGIESLKTEQADIAGASSDSSAPVLPATDIPVTLDIAPIPESRSRDLLGEEWVLALPADSYLIQISSTQNKPFLVGFAKTLPKVMSRGLYTDRKNRLGNNVYVLYAGSFDSIAEANAALLALSPGVKRYGAFVRATRLAQQEIKQSKLTSSSTVNQ